MRNRPRPWSARQVGRGLGVEGVDVEALTVVFDLGAAGRRLEAQRDLDLIVVAAMADGVGGGLLDAEHDVVDQTHRRSSGAGSRAAARGRAAGARVPWRRRSAGREQKCLSSCLTLRSQGSPAKDQEREKPDDQPNSLHGIIRPAPRCGNVAPMGARSARVFPWPPKRLVGHCPSTFEMNVGREPRVPCRAPASEQGRRCRRGRGRDRHLHRASPRGSSRRGP